jgi:DNA-binding NarL/FixJ family response regulator
VTVRILLVDDFEEWRRTVRELLQARPELQVIGEASEGLGAVQKAGELKPDLIVLDIGLPKLNGIEAARQIRQLSPNSKIIFLSQDNSLDPDELALSTGAQGYVYKAQARIELVPAVEAVLKGERFVSSNVKGYKSTDIPATKAPHRHEFLFFSDDTVLLDTFARFIAAALKADNGAIAVVMKSQQESLRQRLKAESVDIDGAIQQGTFILLDVADALGWLLVDGLPDPVRFFKCFSGLIETASEAAKAEHPRVAICCASKGCLWGEGKMDAAIRLEQQCNDLAKTNEVDILCAYPSSCVYGAEDEHLLKIIYAEHSAVCS